CQQYSNSPFSF
nr:immunoglobulin light chain junction region [Macaca mulatta]MOW08357.1 immunoglobulin light chain junction region [Macaca mulatta]MOW08367.1 immunoglobulin light chain junction region [Macaca mulatta]MOW09380.1 immunoglobulin light chain junction region [Macaca mulatta]MOW09387.1 immunoglobulin light chain junction region [Macaca mulatta]